MPPTRRWEHRPGLMIRARWTRLGALPVSNGGLRAGPLWQ
jgi:hypothetical protein